jgi:hypothetical protein
VADYDAFHPRDPLIDKNLNLVQSFLTQCSAKHAKCTNVTMGFAPTRLIDVGGTDPNTLRLVGLKIEQRKIKYAALSYCWGKPKPNSEGYKSNKSNIHDRYSGFSLSEQPPAIQDAVEVARSLRIPFLWVDAICIIQGDKEDWEREGLQMDKVYENAYVTIAATSTESVWDSFLFRPSICTELSFMLGSKERTMNFLRFRYPSAPTALDAMAECPWSLRGWTMQEQALATRSICFTPHFFYVECLCEQKMEISSRSPPTRTPRPWQRDAQETSDSYQEWYTVVEQYTTRQFTFHSDKLLAIAGLANRILKNLPNDEYLSGLFKGDICRGILWTAIREGQSVDRIESIPSWSWASYPGPVSYGEGSDVSEYVPHPGLTIEPNVSSKSLVILGRILLGSKLWPNHSLVPASCKISNGEQWTLWPDTDEKTQVPDSCALAIWSSPDDVCGLLLKIVSKGERASSLVCRRLGYFEVSLDPGTDLFLDTDLLMITLL